jgi:hypothetical protein
MRHGINWKKVYCKAGDVVPVYPFSWNDEPFLGVVEKVTINKYGRVSYVIGGRQVMAENLFPAEGQPKIRIRASDGANMKLRQAAQQALEALESVFEGDDKGAEFWTVTGGTYEAVECMQARRALVAALAEPKYQSKEEKMSALERVIEEQQKEIDRLKKSASMNIEAWHKQNEKNEQLVQMLFSHLNSPTNETRWELLKMISAMGYCITCQSQDCECNFD